MPAEKLFVVKRADGHFLAIDSNSGGYPWWPEHPMQAERFRADERAISYIRSIKDEEMTIHEILLGPAMTPGEFESVSSDEVRKKALAKLSETERRVLGL